MRHNEVISMVLGLAALLGIGFNQLETKYLAHHTKPKKILLVWGQGTGEQEQTHRFRIAAKRLGYDLEVVSDTDKGKTSSMAARHFKPDLVLTIERNIPPITAVPNYLVLDQSYRNYIEVDLDGNTSLKKRIPVDIGGAVIQIDPQYEKFAGFLPTFPNIELLKQACANDNKKFYGFNWYPTVYATEYVAQTPQRVFYPGGVLTDDTRGADKYKNFFAMLDQQDYLEVYGFEDRWQHTPRSIRGALPFNGISLIKINNKFGITLLLHAKDHLRGDVPTGRIFEAAAANTVIISDQNKFILDNFGDNVLYVDVTQDEQAIFAQIDKHVQWIFANPEQAKQMAQRCHAIFTQRFTLEAQLQRLVELNDEVLKSHLL